MPRLAGKVAIVTGGARGMGASHARSIVREGGTVVIGDILDDAGKELAAELGESAVYVHLDVTKETDWAAAVATAVGQFGALNVLVNNAGIINRGSIDEYSLDQWNAIMAINATGTFLGVKSAISALRDFAPSSIVNISSSDGLVGSVGRLGYTASKFAITGLTKSLALELGPDGVRVNSVHPGGTRTDMSAGVDESLSPSALRRFADPVEVSNLVVYLASDESSYSTGGAFTVDGGMTAGIASKPPRTAPPADSMRNDSTPADSARTAEQVAS
jgi:3alpha(or 20beta)-hydroxysteroid dehydrogenase